VVFPEPSDSQRRRVGPTDARPIVESESSEASGPRCSPRTFRLEIPRRTNERHRLLRPTRPDRRPAIPHSHHGSKKEYRNGELLITKPDVRHGFRIGIERILQR
jgi:hypothetical protein